MKMQVNTTVEIDPWEALTDISTEELAEVLASRRAAAKTAEPPSRSPVDIVVDDIDREVMEEALWHWRCGRSADAVYHLEKALGRPWNGLADLVMRVAA